MLDTNKTLLALDFGTQYFGVAHAQLLTGSASPLAVLKVKDGVPNWDELLKVISEYQPQAILLGIPLNMDGSCNDITLRANKFRNRLIEKSKLPVWGVDERLSSFEAKERLLARGTKAHKFKQANIDGEAAVLIFETWYESYQSGQILDQLSAQDVKAAVALSNAK
jgi:putative holliday junction resolvase